MVTWIEYLHVHTIPLDRARGRHTPIHLSPISAIHVSVIQRSTLPQSSTTLLRFPLYKPLLLPPHAHHQSQTKPAVITYISELSKGMASRAVSSFTSKPSLPSPRLSHGSASSPPVSLRFPRRRSSAVVVAASSASSSVDTNNMPLTGVLFQPFEEVKKADLAIPITSQVSLARQRYADPCEAAVNEQINVEYNVSYVYHSMYAYFDRDNVALKGLAKFFKEASDEEREHAEKLMEYQNKRGGRVKLHPIVSPVSEFEHAEKGDALYAMELALSLEKLTNEKLLTVHTVASENGDPQLADFIESEFLGEQVEAIKKISDYITQLRMIGKGHGVWHFDKRLLTEAA